MMSVFSDPISPSWYTIIFNIIFCNYLYAVCDENTRSYAAEWIAIKIINNIVLIVSSYKETIVCDIEKSILFSIERLEKKKKNLLCALKEYRFHEPDKNDTRIFFIKSTEPIFHKMNATCLNICYNIKSKILILKTIIISIDYKRRGKKLVFSWTSITAVEL